jgi:membrane protease YdiL (CAAX protease family)
VSINNPTSRDNLLGAAYPDSFEQPVSHIETPVPDPDDPSWGTLSAFLVWLLSVALLLLLQLVVAIPYVVYKVVLHGGAPQDLGTDPTLIFISILSVLPAHILTFLAVWLVVTRAGKRPCWQSLGWHWPSNFGPWQAIGLAVLLLVLGGLATWFYGGSETQLDQIVNSSLKARFVTAVLAALTGPLVEELVYRGVMYSALKKAFGVTWAVAVVSILFGGVHVLQYYKNVAVIAVIALLSITLTVVRARSRSLLPSYIMHLVFNGIQAVILMVQPFVGKPAVENAPALGVIIHDLARLLT